MMGHTSPALCAFTVDVAIAAPPPAADDAFYSAAELARLFGLPAGPLRKRLERWLAQHDDGWIEVADPKSHSPRRLYRLGAVARVIEACRLVHADKTAIRLAA